jgi:DUF1365 family protein
MCSSEESTDGPCVQPPTTHLLSALLYEFLKAMVAVVWHGIPLLLRTLLLPKRSSKAARAGSRGCDFYEGTVKHTRLAPLKHHFTYNVRYCLIDLDAPAPSWCASLLEDRLSAAQAREMAGVAGGMVRLLFLPPSAGYEENPICVYYVYGEDCLQRCIAEVTNTPWGDRVRFCFTPGGFSLPKPMHVSPLQDMEATWALVTSDPIHTLRLNVQCAHPVHGHFFHASLDARRVNPPADVEAWAWLMPHRVTWWIYSHAAYLLWRGLPFLAHPKYDEAGRNAYKQLAAKRAASAGLGRGTVGCCPYVWRDATEHPWC